VGSLVDIKAAYTPHNVCKGFRCDKQPQPVVKIATNICFRRLLAFYSEMYFFVVKTYFFVVTFMFL